MKKLLDKAVTKGVDGAISATLKAGKLSVNTATYIGKKVVENPNVKPVVNETCKIASGVAEVGIIGGAVALAVTHPVIALALAPEIISTTVGCSKKLRGKENE